jgi:hypothetical protein
MPDSVTEVLPAEQTQALALSMHDFEISLENARLLAQMMREHMKEGVHYGRFQRDGKPSLWDPGASLICSAFGVHPQYRVLEHREDDETGHFRLHAFLFLGRQSLKLLGAHDLTLAHRGKG